MRLHPLADEQQHERFAYLHNAPDSQFSRKRRKLDDFMTQRGFIEKKKDVTYDRTRM